MFVAFHRDMPTSFMQCEVWQIQRCAKTPAIECTSQRELVASTYYYLMHIHPSLDPSKGYHMTSTDRPLYELSHAKTNMITHHLAFSNVCKDIVLVFNFITLTRMETMFCHGIVCQPNRGGGEDKSDITHGGFLSCKR